MNSPESQRDLPGLRRYLLLWFAGIAILMVVAYTELLDYYLDRGVNLGTRAFLERTASDYVKARPPGTGIRLGRSTLGYTQVDNIPAGIGLLFPLASMRHGEMLRRVNIDIDDDDVHIPVDTIDICPSANCDLLFIYPHQISETEWLYLVHGIVATEDVFRELDVNDQIAVAIGILFAVLLVLVSWLVIRNIDAPLRRLGTWSADLGTDHVAPTPDLRFREFATLADRLRFAFERMREGVNKEKMFLRHASHELRTPLAILSSNLELLERLTDRPDRSEAERASLVRLGRALDDMKLMMETLLWVNQQSETQPRFEEIMLADELAVIVDTYRYLVDAGEVAVSVTGHSPPFDGPAVAVRIVLSNLVRNAFQYTQDGEVAITIRESEVVVENEGVSVQGVAIPVEHEDDYGFGFGLELVDLICRRFDWQCDTEEKPSGWKTRIRF